MSAGRPLRFLGWVLGGWAGLRLATVAMSALWFAEPPTDERVAALPEEKGPEALRGAPLERPEAIAFAGEIPPAPAVTLPGRSRFPALPPVLLPGEAPMRQSGQQPTPPAFLLPGSVGPAPPKAAQRAEAMLPSPPAAVAGGSPWSVTAWMLWRREGGAALAPAPLLGGSQGGIRIDYRLWSAGTRSLSLYGRVTRALERPFADEAAAGVALRPIEGIPVSLLAERRQRLGSGGRSGFAFLAAGGFGPEPVAGRVEAEGYAQAGVVTTPGTAGFADGRLGIDYRLTPQASRPDIAVGVAVSAGVQPGASRVDIGPQVRLRLPVAGGTVRLTAEWRQRIAGAARPASGPSLALTADF